MWEVVIGPFDTEAAARAWRDHHLPAALPDGKLARVAGGAGDETLEVLCGQAPVPLPDANPAGTGPGAG